MTTSERIWHLMAKALNCEASSFEQEELSVLLSENESLHQQYELLTRIWNEKDGYVQDEENARLTIMKIINKASEEDVAVFHTNLRRRRRRQLFIAATIVLVLIAGGWFIKLGGSSSAPVQNERQEALVAKKGSRSRSLLPDGTTVWLNAGSKLSYENDFTGSTREVRLEGEAFFDVTKQINRPFIVHTSGIEIKVLGTAFNVKSYPEDKTVETTLYRGSVKVFRQEESEKNAIDLRPNQKLILSKQAAIDSEKLSEEVKPTNKELPTLFTIAPIDSTKKESERFETAWLYSRLEFRGDSFEELARKLERWYNVEIAFSDEKVKQLNFNGSFEKETVEQAFVALHAALPLFTYNISNHEISVGSSK